MISKYSKISLSLCAIALIGILFFLKPKPLLKRLPSSQTHINFNNLIPENEKYNITKQQYLYNGGGVATADFNNDGLSDIFLVGNLVSNELYLNQGQFKFKKVTQTAQLETTDIWSSGATVIDINCDGKLDLYISNTFHEDPKKRKNLLYINQGNDADGTPIFSEEAEAYNIADTGYSTHSVFFDYDNDGDLDLYVLTNKSQIKYGTAAYTKLSDGSSPSTDRLYRNNGDESFSNVSNAAGIKLEGHGLGIAVVDINNDGWKDLYISNDFITNDILYINNKNGTFSNQIKTFLSHQSHSAMGNDASDYNNDGHIDLIAVDMLPATHQREKQMFPKNAFQYYKLLDKKNYERQYNRNTLQRNNGNLTFSDMALITKTHATDWSWAPLFADLDQDGLRDLFITNGFPRDVTDRDYGDFINSYNSYFKSLEQTLGNIPVVKLPNYVFKNTNGEQFEDISKQWGIDTPSFSNGLALADLDNDGDLDIVTNNINDEAFVYENRLNNKNHYLKLKLMGPSKNPLGLGVKIKVKTKDSQQVYEHSFYRGYLSSIDPHIHFGLGENDTIENLQVLWPDGLTETLTQISSNQTLMIEHKNASQKNSAPTKQKAILTQISVPGLSSFKHQEIYMEDYLYQRLLPRKHSYEGPGIAIADINQDGLEDVIIGQTDPSPRKVFFQSKNGNFKAKSLPTLELKKEEQGLLLIDINEDQELDLIVANGSSEYPAGSALLKNTLLLQNNTQFSPSTLPSDTISHSFVVAADYDKDQDLDILIGGRLKPQQYPQAVSSRLLNNSQGLLEDKTDTDFPAGIDIGMATAALWTDFDNDTWVDLIIVGEWMPIRVFKNHQGKLLEYTEALGLNSSSGWWNSIAAGDFDNDGDTDYILGNQGLNTLYEPKPDKPLLIMQNDLDHNKSIDPIMFSYRDQNYYPTHLKKDLTMQLPILKKEFLTYSQYGSGNLKDIVHFFKDNNPSISFLQAHRFDSIYLENIEGKKLKAKPLPFLAQSFPVHGILVDDFDNDQNLDVLLVGNRLHSETFASVQDAGHGLYLKGNGKGDFQTLSIQESGFYVPGDARALAQFYNNQGEAFIVATRSNDSLKIFKNNTKIRSSYLLSPQALDTHVIISYKDGTQRLQELYHGSGYLSQSSRKIRLDSAKLKKIVISNSKGDKRSIEDFKP